MSKNIVLLSDGTGNSASKVWRTNVWRLFKALDLTTPDQVACYDDGVGTSAFKPLAILGGAFGWGLKRNVIDLYKFLCRNYDESESHIYGFGFSRGAFTIRVLMGLVGHQGIVKFDTEAELDRKAKAAYRAYRAARYHSFLKIERPFRWLRNGALAAWDKVRGRKSYDPAENKVVEDIRFVGLWDTVAAYGLPIDEMTRGVSQWLWPLELPDRVLSGKVKRACHALALDDERTTFHPVLWTEAGEKSPVAGPDGPSIDNERLTQVWFPGVHSNVGGGYPDDSLAHIPLYWMVEQAKRAQLRFRGAPDYPDAIAEIKSARDKDGRLYDPRQGTGGYYRYGPRKIADLCHTTGDDGVEIALPKIHESAFQRIRDGSQIYAPIGLPANYAVLQDNGRLLAGPTNPYETPKRATGRAAAQEYVWNDVWARRVVYFLTLAASFHLILFPLTYSTDKSAEFSDPLRLVSETLRLAAAFLPNLFDWWIDSFAARPGRFLLGALVLIGLISYGSRLGTRITDQMNAFWDAGASLPQWPKNPVYKLRTAGPYQWIIRTMKRRIVPFLSAVLIVYLGVAVVSRLAFNIEDTAGVYCKKSPGPSAASDVQGVTTVMLPADSICQATGVHLKRGNRYDVKVTIAQIEQWRNGGYEPGLGGLGTSGFPTFADRAMMFLAAPFRRVFRLPWYQTIARVGEMGGDEYFFDPDEGPEPRPKLLVMHQVLVPRRDGELFLYTNDAVLGFPPLADMFYRNNSGEAQLTVEPLIQ